MIVFHLQLDSDVRKNIGIVQEAMGGEDVLVVAPGADILLKFNEILEKQLVRKEDATHELAEWGQALKALASESDSLFGTETDTTLERIHDTLLQGMSLSFHDNSLENYLKAHVVNLCARCVSGYLGEAACVDGRSLVICESIHGVPVVDWQLTASYVAGLPKGAPTIVGGLFGRKVSGETIDLGIHGSELTANIIGSVRKAGTVRFYMGRTGYSGCKSLTFEEEAQRYASDSLIYPPALLPAKRSNIPVEIADLSLDGEVVVTISPASEISGRKGITGVIVSEPMTLFTVSGTGLMGTIGIASALFGTLADKGVNIHFISQSVSEYSISFAVRRSKEGAAGEALKALIGDRCQAGSSDLSFAADAVRIVSVFGQSMRNVPGISGKVFSALGKAGINVIASSQGGEELSISIVVTEPDAPSAQAALEELKGD